MAAAYLQEHDAYGRSQWGAESLRNEDVYSIQRYQPPVEVETAIAAVWRGNRLLTPIGGGVTMQPRIALDATNVLMDDEGLVSSARGKKLAVPQDRWWWD